MAATTQAASSTAPTVITESMQRLLQVRDLWTRSQKDQLEIGRLLYEERKERLGVGGRGVEVGFAKWLREAGIPRKSAYRRIAEYEVSIGERKAENETSTCWIRRDENPHLSSSGVGPSPRTNSSDRSGRISCHEYIGHPPTGISEDEWQQMRHEQRVALTQADALETKPVSTDTSIETTAAPAVATRLEVVDDGSGVVQYIETPDETPVDAAAAFTTELLNDECAAEDYFLNDPKSKTWLPFGIKCNNPQRAAATRTYQISFGGFGMLTVAQVRLLADTLRTAGISCRPPLSMVRTKTLYYDTETGEVQDPPPHHGVRRDAASLMGAHIKPVAATKRKSKKAGAGK